ncbi:MAG: hypothetical protein HZB29_00150 [Nitrospinae bacterium]|nr:hypothetical protein [Nitrospinota bacterium]
MRGRLVHAIVLATGQESAASAEIAFKSTKSSPSYEAYWPTYKIISQEESSWPSLERPVATRVKSFKGAFVVVELETDFAAAACSHAQAVKNALHERGLSIARNYSPGADYEEYTFFCVCEYSDYDRFLSENGLLVSQLLKDESATLAAEEINETLQSSLRYDTEDLTVIEWDGALLLDKNGDFEDNMTLLELANIQLLALRTLDANLTREIDRFKQFGDIKTVNLFRLSTFLKSIIKVRTRSLFELEAIDNSIKLFGDWYSAKVYSIAAKKLYHTRWRESVDKKLALLEKMFEMVSHRQMETFNVVLEFSIVLLIVAEIVLILGGKM